MNQPYTIYYLGHSAWAIETIQHYLLFDCQNENALNGGLLADGKIDFASFGDKPVYVFYSHKHHDHYSRKLHILSGEYAHVFNILGDFDTAITANTAVVHPRETHEFGSIKVQTAGSTDEGVCFLVEADDLVIFFAGDNADWGDGDENNRLYFEEIDYIAERGVKIDIAFIPVCTYSGQRPASMTQGAFYAINRLNPCVTYPMHANGREDLYEAFEKDLRKSGCQANIICAKQVGRVI